MYFRLSLLNGKVLGSIKSTFMQWKLDRLLVFALVFFLKNTSSGKRFKGLFRIQKAHTANILRQLLLFEVDLRFCWSVGFMCAHLFFFCGNLQERYRPDTTDNALVWQSRPHSFCKCVLGAMRVCHSRLNFGYIFVRNL